MKRIYLDYASTTPIDKDVLRSIDKSYLNNFGNAGSLHYFGQMASREIFEAKKFIGEKIGAKYNEIIFLGSASEANNLALIGTFQYAKKKFGANFKPHFIVSSIEHESILQTVKHLEFLGAEISYTEVDRYGFINLESLKKSLKENTVCVSIMFGNNEIGTIEPISEIAKVIAEYKKGAINHFYPLFHTDASQALQFFDLNVDSLGVDFMSLSSHKIYGPKGIACLYAKNQDFKGKKINNFPIEPIIFGGGQEFGLRSGTESLELISGFKKAIEINEAVKNKNKLFCKKLSQYFLKRIKSINKKIQLNGPDFMGNKRLPNNINIYIPGFDSEKLLIDLDLRGVAASSGSACIARKNQPSYVIKALNLEEHRPKESIRFSLGKDTNKKDIDTVLKILKNILKNHE